MEAAPAGRDGRPRRAGLWWGPSQEFFDLSSPTGFGLATAAVVVVLASTLLYVLHRTGRLAPLGAEEEAERSGGAGAA